jgi:hypothetical protein
VATDLNLLRETIKANRATHNTSQSNPEKTVYVSPKGELLLGGEVIVGTAEELSVVRQETFAV